MGLREYQERAVANVRAAWEQARAVLICSPTGSGKTEQGRALATGWHSRPIWLCHRNDLLDQAKQRVGDTCDVVSIPSLARRNQLDWATPLVVFDEAHHIASKSWLHAASLFPSAKILGLTATPERADGSPLGDVFEKLVVAATYSELLALGHLAPCRVFRPSKQIENGLALDPVAAYLRYTPGKRGFCFVSTVKQAAELRERFEQKGVRAVTLHGNTNKDVRHSHIERLSAGDIDLIINCSALTEGVDVPSAEVCILGRRCQHSGLFIQITGRILRVHPSKSCGTLLDLVAATARHGLPTDDREYALAGSAIRRSQAPALRQCYLCGAVMLSSAKLCISCGCTFVPGVHRPPKVHSMELREVYAGSETPDPAKCAELERLCRKMPWPGAAKRFCELFGSRPTQAQWAQLPHELALTEYHRMLKSRSPQQSAVIMKGYTGKWIAKFSNQ